MAVTTLLEVLRDHNSVDTRVMSRSSHIDTLVMVANTSQNIPVPANAKFAKIIGSGPFWCKFDGGTAVIPAASVTDGSSKHLFNPDLLNVGNLTSLSFIAAANGHIQIQWFK